MSATGRGGDRQARDAYFTPDALASCLVGLLDVQPGDRVLEPHGGGGAFVRALARQTEAVESCDVDPALVPGLVQSGARRVIGRSFLEVDGGPWDWIVGNPPYLDAEAHVRHALRLSGNVAFLLRLAFLESAERIALWTDHPPHRVWVLAGRPAFVGQATDKTAYGFIWWRAGSSGPAILEVLDWDERNRSRKRHERSTALSRWPLLEDDAATVIEAIAPKGRIAVPDGAEDSLWQALANYQPVPLDGAGSNLDRVIGAPPPDRVEALVPFARTRLAPGGKLVLLLPLHVLESRGRVGFWKTERPSRIEVVSRRMRFVDGRAGAHAFGLFWWDRAPAEQVALSVVDLRAAGTASDIRPLVEALRSNPKVRELNAGDARLSTLVSGIVRKGRMGPRLDEIVTAQVVTRKMCVRLEALAARIAELERMSVTEELGSLVRAVCRDERRARAIVRHLGWDGAPPATAEEVAQTTGLSAHEVERLTDHAVRLLRRVNMFAPALRRALEDPICPALRGIDRARLPRIQAREWSRLG